jgi:hypothetical protein
MNGTEEHYVRVLAGKPKLKRLLGIPRWKDNTSIYLKEIGWGGDNELDSSGARQV